MLRKRLLASFFCCAAGGCTAGSLSNVTITKLHINRGLPQKVFIATSTPVSGQQHPSCATDLNWNYVMPLVTDSDKALYSALLTAFSSQALVDFGATEVCDVYSSIESVGWISTHK